MFQLLLKTPLSRLATAALSLGIVSCVAVPVRAQTALLRGFETTGADLVGANITASFLDGTTESLIWATQSELGLDAGGVFSDRNWSLTQQGNSFFSPWELNVGSGLALTSLVIDLLGGNAVFDIEPDPLSERNTPGSEQGVSFGLHRSTMNPNLSPTTIDYFSPIDISQGDLFTGLRLEWENGFSNNLLRFVTDTDSGTVENPVTVVEEPDAWVVEDVVEEEVIEEEVEAPEPWVIEETEVMTVPEPSMALGLLAIAALSRRKSKPQAQQ